MKKNLYGIFPLITYGIAFYFSVTAYGNKIRQSNFEKDSPLGAILASFVELFEYAEYWMTLQIFLFMLLLIPIFWKMVSVKNFHFKYPALFTFLSVCSNACMMTPGLYAMGTVGAGRTINIIKMWFILMLFLNEAYWIGYIKQKIAKENLEKMPDIRIWIGGILFLVFVSFVLNKERQGVDYSSYMAYVSLRSGEAELWHEEYMERVELLNSEIKEVELIPYSVKPYLLYLDDVTTHSYDWQNWAVARWYSKDKVYLRE